MSTSSTSRSAVSSLNVNSWLMDFGSVSSPTSPSNQPPASRPCDFPASASPHWPKRWVRKSSSSWARSPTLRMPQRLQVFFGDLTDARDLANVQRREEARFLAGEDPQDSVGLGLIGGDLGDHPGSRDSDRAVEPGFAFHCFVQAMRGGERRSMQALGAGEIHVGFVDGRHLDLRRETFQHAGRLCANSRDSDPDAHPRRSPAGRAGRRSAAAWRSGRRICAPHRTPPRLRRAGRICRRRRPVCLSATGRTALPRRRKTRPCRRGSRSS